MLSQKPTSLSLGSALAQPKLADVVFNMTQDKMHYHSTLAALGAGYDILLEKPMTTSLLESVHLVQEAERLERLLVFSCAALYPLL